MPEETRETEQEPNPESVTTEERGQAGSYQARVQKLESTDTLLNLARKAAPDPSIFDDTPPYFWSAEISSNRQDAYYTRMHSTTLRNFAAEASEGRAFLDSHRSNERPIGYSLQGRFVGGSGNGVSRVEADFYTVQHPALPGMPTQQLVTAIRSGIQRDVSVGFYLGEDGEYRCILCSRDMLNDHECSHIPGLKYSVPDEKDSPPRTATAWIINAHLAETSGVYDGATPGAIIKAAQEAAAGRLQPEAARLLETRYRGLQLPAAHHAWSGADLPEQKETPMPDNESRAPAESAEWTLPAAERERYRTLVTECGLKPDAPPAAIVESLRSQIAAHATERDTAVTERDTLKAENERLKPQAEDGMKFRATLRKQVEETYVAAKGDRANVAAKASAWDTGTIEFLQAELAEYEPERAARFPGGRLTTDGAPAGFVTPSAPTAAFRA